ncbi:hypothetical protein BDR26DRAFT_1008987 [Obelidium mucronatum]|nr:hypothetical protein BDR26DRAFT_1008987 [Obelidium mucronatum]
MGQTPSFPDEPALLLVLRVEGFQFAKDSTQTRLHPETAKARFETIRTSLCEPIKLINSHEAYWTFGSCIGLIAGLIHHLLSINSAEYNKPAPADAPMCQYYDKSTRSYRNQLCLSPEAEDIMNRVKIVWMVTGGLTLVLVLIVKFIHSKKKKTVLLELPKIIGEFNRLDSPAGLIWSTETRIETTGFGNSRRHHTRHFVLLRDLSVAPGIHGQPYPNMVQQSPPPPFSQYQQSPNIMGQPYQPQYNMMVGQPSPFPGSQQYPYPHPAAPPPGHPQMQFMQQPMQYSNNNAPYPENTQFQFQQPQYPAPNTNPPPYSFIK